MRIRADNLNGDRSRVERAMTLVEVMIAVVGVGILLVTLYVAISQGFAIIQTARENLRATQVLQEKMETMRLFKWDTVAANGFPHTFVEPFYAVGDNNNGGFNYVGTAVTNPLPSQLRGLPYSDDLRLVTIQVEWQSGNVVRRREMRTLISEFGLQTYVY